MWQVNKKHDKIKTHLSNKISLSLMDNTFNYLILLLL